MRILTFCAHQPYIYLFAGMGLELDIVELEGKRFLQNWDLRVRPLPKGWRLLSWPHAKAALQQGRYHAALAHNISDYIDLVPYRLPKVLLFHTSLSSRLSEERSAMDPDVYKRELVKLVRQTGGKMVFVSEHKRLDWNLPGAVIPLVVNTEDYQGYRGEQAAILRVSNQLIERGEILDYSAHCYLSADLPLTLIGQNPLIPGAAPASSWEALKEAYRSHRVYLHTAKQGLEDGYNTAMLEAMSTGMPIAATAHPTSPIIDGVNGVISANLSHLRQGIQRLLSDPSYARELGARSRETAMKTFSAARFERQWRELFEMLLAKSGCRPGPG